jgi:ABC-type antimicrobial peptide transport system permease subunit
VSGFPGYSADGSASGGTDDIVTVLSQSDVDAAKNKLTSGANGDQFAKDFENKLSGQGEYVLTSTLKTGDAQITANPDVGQPASTATVNIKITYTVLTVKKNDLKQVIQAKLSDQVDKSKQKLSDSFMDDASITVQGQSSPTSVVLLVNEDTTAVPIIDTANVKKIAEGKKAGDIKTAINAWPGVESVDVKLSPFWVSKVPTKASKVTVILKEDKSKQAGQGNSEP